MNADAHFPGDHTSKRVVTFVIPTVEYVILNSLFGHLLTDGNGDLTRTAPSAFRIDLYDLRNLHPAYLTFNLL
jgi:hypothetical protein